MAEVTYSPAAPLYSARRKARKGQEESGLHRGLGDSLLPFRDGPCGPAWRASHLLAARGSIQLDPGLAPSPSLVDPRPH